MAEQAEQVAVIHSKNSQLIEPEKQIGQDVAPTIDGDGEEEQSPAQTTGWQFNRLRPILGLLFGLILGQFLPY